MLIARQSLFDLQVTWDAHAHENTTRFTFEVISQHLQGIRNVPLSLQVVTCITKMGGGH